MPLRATALFLLGLLSLPLMAATGVSVPLARDLQHETQQLPIMLVFSAEYCPYCVLMDEEFLNPMLISGDYTDKVIIRKVEIDSGTLLDFNGERISGAALAQRYGVRVTPTTLFVDVRGHELAPRRVGIGTLEFFGGELDQSIELALTKLRHIQVAGCEIAGSLC